MLLPDLSLAKKYSPASGNLLHKFYIPVLQCSVRYDRATGFFSAKTLVAAAAGVKGLIENNGKMRLLVGCTLKPEQVAAINRGENLAQTVDNALCQLPFDDPSLRNSLELLAWMIANGYLQIQIALPRDMRTKKLLSGEYIFHEKCGIVADAAGNRVAFNGSLNETLAGWQSRNWDSFHVFCSWRDDQTHLEEDEQSFQRLWANAEPTAEVLPLGEAIQKKLLSFLPPQQQRPKLLQKSLEADKQPTPEEFSDQYTAIWRKIHTAPALAPGGKLVGEATSAVIPWPHQRQAFERMYQHWPPRLLIADEVGLGKTIQAGLLLRQAWLAGRAKRILIMAPKAVLGQWQLELREKFNLIFPIYDGNRLHWPEILARQTPLQETVGDADWHKQPFLLVSSELMRRKERATQLLHDAEPWDALVLDEAHHARRKGVTANNLQNRPNMLLRLMRELKNKTAGLILLTATPMQIDPIEVWDLLALLDLPQEWTATRFLDFFRYTAHPMPSNSMLASTSALFRACESKYGEMNLEEAMQITGLNKILAKSLLKTLRDAKEQKRERLSAKDRLLAMKLMRNYTPIRMSMSRHTRELLRKYRKMGKLAAKIADRQVQDLRIIMQPQERELYTAMENYISATYNNANKDEQNAVGFVMTIYRRRLASSFFALAQTLQNRLDSLTGEKLAALDSEDLPGNELEPEQMGEDEAKKAEKMALAAEEAADIAALLGRIRKLETDTKALRLFEVLAKLQAEGYRQIMVFTQYTDTLDFLRREILARLPGQSLLCFSGRGGELWQNGNVSKLSRDKTKEIFSEGKAEIMLCTDAAAEGLNFQFCGALINYDMPWNPMRVEQRIGRIDRLGQEHDQIKIINFMYANTVETDIYQALRQRISLFGAYVGKLQPILAKLPKTIEDLALSGDRSEARIGNAIADMEAEIEAGQNSGFDLDEAAAAAMFEETDEQPAYDLNWLNEVLNTALPPGYALEPNGKDYSYYIPGKAEPVRVTCDADYYIRHSESCELWSPGSPIFPWRETSKFA